MASPEQHYFRDDHTDTDDPGMDSKEARLLRQAEKEIAAKTEALKKTYDQLAEFEQRIEDWQQKARQLEVEARSLRQKLRKEEQRAEGGELAYQEAEKKISELENASKIQRRRAQDAMKELKARFEDEESKSARLEEFIGGVVTQVNSYKNQMVQDNKDRALFEKSILKITGVYKERSKKISDDMQKMKTILASSQRTLTSKAQRLYFPGLGHGMGYQGPGVVTGGSGLMRGSEWRNWPNIQGIPVNDNLEQHLNRLELPKYLRPHIDPDSTLPSPSNDSVAEYSDRWSHSSTMSIHHGQFMNTLDTELGLDSMETSRTSSRLDSVSDHTYLAPDSSRVPQKPLQLSDSESDVLTVDSEDETNPWTWYVHSPPMRPSPRKRMRFSSPENSQDQADGMRSTEPGADSGLPLDDEDLTEDRPATPPKKAKITHPKSILVPRRPIIRKLPSRAEQEFRIQRAKAAEVWLKARKDPPPTSPPISPEATSSASPTPAKQEEEDPWIIHKHLEDLPFRSVDIQTDIEWTADAQTGTEWPERSFTRAVPQAVFAYHEPPISVRPIRPVLNTRRASKKKQDASKKKQDANKKKKDANKESQDKPEWPTALMPGRWPIEDTSEEDAGSVTNPEAHVWVWEHVGESIEEFKRWIRHLMDERPNELAWGILFMGSLLWVVVSHRTHRQWMDANEVPLDILAKLRNSRMSEIRWTESFDFGVMRLFHHDRTILG
ncbi:uncharacterized protein N7483_002697 [Penicillium malachiteum]|uniref:uncharacterized protein n=1 Tax=Penicillium malachiteum TaxID=1324776 RepID=UPI0025493B59|nr:uncharacterized protein N7483_002697 [Penicillium malachiteum]KAJ5737572.1 hypothetical protein N7483_002697 [Penicillium malachiteum]